MFPGYRLGETTQRIAAGIFEEVCGYENGIQFASFYMPGKFSHHVRMMKIGYENVEKARAFGLPYIVLKVPKPYDTTTLNYNWQIWETNAFSLYGTVTDTIDEKSAEESVNSILHFMKSLGILKAEVLPGVSSRVFTDRELFTLRPTKSGIFRSLVEEIRADVSGVLFFAHDKPLVYASTAIFKLLP